MAERVVLLEYLPRASPMHRRNGAAKLATALSASIAAMITYDTRLLLVIAAASMLAFAVSRIRLGELAFVLKVLLLFLLLNNLFIFLFAPEYGAEIYGSRHVIAPLGSWATLTWEQLFYQANVTLKYAAVVPIALVFFTTTSPSEFAASLNRIGVPARSAYAVSLAMRFIPDLQREFRAIASAQQARGLDLSRRTPLARRLRNLRSIVMPLLLINLARVESVATALELRGFDRARRRSWYAGRGFDVGDLVLIGLGIASIAAAVVLLVVNGGRFYTPF